MYRVINTVSMVKQKETTQTYETELHSYNSNINKIYKYFIYFK